MRPDGTPDSTDVAVVIQWLYKPEELPNSVGGRKPWHGSTEVMPANWLDIIDPECIANRVRLYYRNKDQEDEEELDGGEQKLLPGQVRADFEEEDDGAELKLYWRQFFDAQKCQLAPPHRFCVCKKPCNPHEVMIKCEKCSTWLHATCIEAAATKASSTKCTARIEEKEHQADILHIKLTSSGTKGEIKYKELSCLNCRELID